MKTAIITGITGQDGAYLSKLLIEKNYNVIGISRSYNSTNLEKLDYLGIKKDITIKECDLLDLSAIIKFLISYKPDEIYNLAAQSSVKLSFEQPISTTQFNTLSVLNILEAIKTTNKSIKFYQASSSEMFGKVDKLPIKEDSAIHPLSPYAISKTCAHWTTINYRESYNLFACCGILFNHESFLRSEGFFIKKVISESIKIQNGEQEHLRVGNIDIKRDFGYAPEYVKAIWLMMQQDTPDDYIICSGLSTSLRDIIYFVFEKLNLDKSKIIIDDNLYRPVDIVDIYGDNTKAKKVLKWEYEYSFYDVLEKLLEDELKYYQK